VCWFLYRPFFHGAKNLTYLTALCRRVTVAVVALKISHTATICSPLNVSDCVLSHVSAVAHFKQPFPVTVIPAVLFSPSIMEVPLTCNLLINIHI